MRYSFKNSIYQIRHQIFTLSFDSIYDYQDYVNNFIIHNRKFLDQQIALSPNFYGISSLKEYLEIQKRGLPIDPFTIKLKSERNLRGHNMINGLQRQDSFYGSTVNIVKYLTNQPNCMISYRKKPKNCSTVYNIILDISTSCEVSPEKITNHFSKVVAKLAKMQARNIPFSIELYFGSFPSGSFLYHKIVNVTISLKRAIQNINLSQLAFYTSGLFFRIGIILLLFSCSFYENLDNNPWIMKNHYHSMIGSSFGKPVSCMEDTFSQRYILESVFKNNNYVYITYNSDINNIFGKIMK